MTGSRAVLNMRGCVLHIWAWRMAVALRDDCFLELSYHLCCEFPPGHPDFRAFCWNNDFLFEDCCYAHGPAVHVLPAVWDERLELVFPGLDPVVIMQDPQTGALWKLLMGDTFMAGWTGPQYPNRSTMTDTCANTILLNSSV